MQEEIKRQWQLNQPPEVVWEYLTKSDLLELWLSKNDFKPVVGHKFKFVSPYGNDSICEVLEVSPFTTLSYTWQKNSSKDNKPFRSKILWTLTPTEMGTELQLLHNGFLALEDIKPHSDGWKICGNLLEGFLNKDSSKKVNVNGKSFTAVIEVAQAPEQVFERLKEVPKWWSKDFEGRSEKLNDEFIIKHGDAHYSKQKLVEVKPNSRMVWLVTESQLNWIPKDKYEWTNTKMIFDISSKGDKTILHFTHEGLVPEKECYAKCEGGWTMVIKDWLFNLITQDKAI